jgi:PleD family two-component response regulator
VKVADRAQETLAEIGRGRYSFSGGIAGVTPTQSSTEDVFGSADLAAYRAKAAGGARTLLGVDTQAAEEPS